MLRRNLRRMRRYPSLTMFVAGMPVVLLLLFVYVFGGTLGAGLGAGSAGGRAAYLAYVIPGILLIDRRRRRPGHRDLGRHGHDRGHHRPLPHDGHRPRLGADRPRPGQRDPDAAWRSAIVVVVAVLIGFRPTTGPVEWLAAAGLLALAALALTWLSVALGMVAKSVETASNMPMFLMLLPFLSSGFVPTDSMPAGLRWFAEYQPFTPIIETVRGLLLGTPIGNSGVVAVAWCVAISVLGYLWARRLYDRERAA